ncbi:MAG: hypothetical protein H0V33_06870 [Acidimicrobiia bacterium]|nr:hypothetical protein [Acidimicrobiia bacterium]
MARRRARRWSAWPWWAWPWRAWLFITTQTTMAVMPSTGDTSYRTEEPTTW